MSHDLSDEGEGEMQAGIRQTCIPEQTEQEIKVYNRSDIISARAAVRRFAERQGCDVIDQISLSLATWSLAHALDLGGLYQGQIRVDCVQNDQGPAVRVECRRPLAAGRAFVADALDEPKRLVDDLVVETLPSHELCVTLLKWVNRESARARSR